MAVLDILTYPNESLKQASEEVEVFDQSLRDFIDDLEETRLSGPGAVGIAAPQVGKFIRAVIVDVSNMKRPVPNHGHMVLINPEITKEIEKDIDRLQTITERFSKIGSVPNLEVHDIVLETRKAFDYLKKRSSKLIHFSFTSDVEELPVLLNPPLYNWSIENLVKNGIDAMKGKGNIAIQIERADNQVHILLSDTGQGIQKSDHQNIFNPGVTSKKRGWGLGLSLVKRIIEEYHKGKIKVLSSSKEGTIMQISLRIA